MLNIPFFPNDGNRCMQACMQSVIKYYLDKDYSLDQLDELTKRTGDQLTWTPQAVFALYELGLDVKYYSKDPFSLLRGGKLGIYEQYPDDAEYFINNSNVNYAIECSQKLKDYVVAVKGKMPFEKIENHTDKNHAPIMLLDFGKIANKQNYEGHFVVMTGYDSKKVFFHDSGPTNAIANDCLIKKVFIKGWNSESTDNDLILILGKR